MLLRKQQITKFSIYFLNLMIWINSTYFYICCTKFLLLCFMFLLEYLLENFLCILLIFDLTILYFIFHFFPHFINLKYAIFSCFHLKTPYFFSYFIKCKFPIFLKFFFPKFCMRPEGGGSF